MVKVEIFEIEVLFVHTCGVTSYILMVEKGYKKGLFIQNKPFSVISRDYSPQFHYFIRL